ncbi:glycosyltransferase family 2 protein [Flavobacterium crassostreae]|uniref:Glycosyl transferase n=1 Tax=Flavobacterium crassostreae TaxID=1763534 RepID=A0A1B9E978_9FLAO|nr:glycosyltransferase [Flavobacterium crassostreae]OCB78483.1 glycosyl transferase [Flavobacterium crassostreae]
MILLTSILLITIYCITISGLCYGFNKIKTYQKSDLKPQTKFSIVVPFRDEAQNLPLLLDSFSQLNYPSHLFEVLLVDDASKEAFRPECYRFGIQIIQNHRQTNSPKKDAIQTAITTLNTQWMVTTDADCVAPKNWLLTLDNYIQTHKVAMLAAAVNYDGTNSFLHQFQQLDLSSLQGATIGSFGLGQGFMCNGANFAYTKAFFEELNGFHGNATISSGDDVFLLQKAMAHAPEKVHYLKSKNCIITTKPLNNWKSLFYQRVRWASKTSAYQSLFGKLLAVVVFGGNVSWILLVVHVVIEANQRLTAVIFILLKMSVDILLLLQTNAFLNTKKRSYLLAANLFYPFFSTSVAIYSLFGKYEWKGRYFTRCYFFL